MWLSTGSSRARAGFDHRDVDCCGLLTGCELAPIEGDAMVAVGARLGAEAGAPVGRTLRRIAEVTKRVPLASVTRGGGHAKLDNALVGQFL
ncbi:MAG: hypothetical protein DIU78_023415 [Pseudomonadota bacterium]